jgi:hypothetical protein
MNRSIRLVPTAITWAAVAALILYGPITQFAHYHEFADGRVWLGVPNAADVLSNLSFLVVGGWGSWRLWPRRNDPAIRAGWPGYQLFLVSLILTAFGSAIYHLAPDDARLVWDRLPIALACAGLLAGVRADVAPDANGARMTGMLAIAAVASVSWWYVTGTHGQGDLRPYLLLQALPLVLIPLWQWLYKAPRADRIAFAAAIAIYVVAKVMELLDHQVFACLTWISGHTLKHLLASAAAAVIVARLVFRIRLSAGSQVVLPDGTTCNTSLRELWLLYSRFRVPTNLH